MHYATMNNILSLGSNAAYIWMCFSKSVFFQFRDHFLRPGPSRAYIKIEITREEKTVGKKSGQ